MLEIVPFPCEVGKSYTIFTMLSLNTDSSELKFPRTEHVVSVMSRVLTLSISPQPTTLLPAGKIYSSALSLKASSKRIIPLNIAFQNGSFAPRNCFAYIYKNVSMPLTPYILLFMADKTFVIMLWCSTTSF